MFIRVRSARRGDPKHEFDVPVHEVERHPKTYRVVDPKPVASSRPASFISGAARATPKTKARASAGEEKS